MDNQTNTPDPHQPNAAIEDATVLGDGRIPAQENISPKVRAYLQAKNCDETTLYGFNKLAEEYDAGGALLFWNRLWAKEEENYRAVHWFQQIFNHCSIEEEYLLWEKDKENLANKS